MSETVEGIDVASSSQGGPIRWDLAKKLAPENLKFVCVRSGISWGYTDKFFRHNWDSLRGLYDRATYHVVYPGENPARQMESFLRIVGDDLGELPLVLDVELVHGQSPNTIGSCVENCIRFLMDRTGGRKVMVYSRASFINEYVLVNKVPWAWFNDVYWWLAHYGQNGMARDLPPTRPVGVAKWEIHQYTEHGVKLNGMPMANELDWNRFNGDLAAYERFVRGGEQPGEQPEAVPLGIWAGEVDTFLRGQGYTGRRPEA